MDGTLKGLMVEEGEGGCEGWVHFGFTYNLSRYCRIGSSAVHHGQGLKENVSSKGPEVCGSKLHLRGAQVTQFAHWASQGGQGEATSTRKVMMGICVESGPVL